MNETINTGNLPGGNITDKLQRRQKKTGLVIFLVFSCCILAVDIIFFALSFNRPYMGVVLSRDAAGRWSVESLDPNGIANQYGIQTGDIPVEINNQPAQSFLSDYNDSGVIYGFVIKEITVIDKYGQVLSAGLNNNLPSISIIIELLMWFITCLIFWLIGFYVFIKRPWNAVARLFYLCGLFFGLTLGANMAAQRAISAGVPIAACALVISPFVFLHFFLVLPEERARLRKDARVFLVYLPALLTIALFFLIGYKNGQPLPWFRTLRIVEAVLGLIAVAGVAIYNYVFAASARTRQQMKIMLVSAVAAFIPFLCLSFLYTWLSRQNGVPFGLNVPFISFIPIGMGYAIVTQKLLDIDVIIRRSVIYGIITVVMAMVMSAVIFPVLIFRKLIGVPEEVLTALVLGVIATILFGPVTKSTELVVDRLFYKDRYDYRHIIQNLSNSVNNLTDFEDVSRLIVVTTSNTLNLSGACLFVKAGPSYELRAALGTFDAPDKQAMLVELSEQRNQLIEFPNSASTIDPDVAFMIPLLAAEKEIGLLFISPKASRQNFSNNDIYLLQGIASVAASALRNAVLVRDVSIRNTFISIASHELRTPLTAIVGFADLLVHDNVPNEATRKRWLKTIFDKGVKLSRIADDLLNVSRIQSGRIRMKLEPVDLSFVLDEQLTMIRPNTKMHEFKIDIEPGLPEAFVDRDKFGHVVGNLLNNAVKYSPNGGHIVVAAHYDGERSRIVVSIADEGIGISPEDKKMLFTTFHRIQRPETVNISGYGLGLYIAKEWTEAMGGEIWLESELNKGTTFFIKVPVLDGSKPVNE